MAEELEYRYEKLMDELAVLRAVRPEENFYNVYILGRKGAAAIVDAAVADAADGLIQTLQENGWRPEDFRSILITHEHGDHYGAAPALARWAGHAEIMAHVCAARAMGQPPQRDQAPAVRTQRLLWDGDTVQISGAAWQVLHVPGHAAGHVLLHDPARHVALAGDMIQGCRASKGWLGLIEDVRLQRQSLQRLRDLNPSLVLMGHHHPLAKQEIGQDIAAALNRLDKLIDAIAEPLRRGINDIESLGRLAFQAIFQTQPDPIPPYALVTVRAILTELSLQGLAALERSEQWRWAGP